MLSMADVLNLPDGTYLVQTGAGLVLETVDYAERWAYGYIVGIAPLTFKDIKSGTLFGVWTNDDGAKEYDLVRHVDAYADAVKLGRDMDQTAIWDLREKKAVYL